MDASDWDDKRILEQTVMKQAAGNAALFNLSLDVGDVAPIVSDTSSPDELRKHMIAWCEGVRAEIRARVQRDKDAAKAALAKYAVPAGNEVKALPTGLQTPQNAIAYAEKQHEIAQEMLADFSGQQARLQTRIEEVRDNLAVWSAVIAQFRKATAVAQENADDLPE
jgi:hypothetical protein